MKMLQSLQKNNVPQFVSGTLRAKHQSLTSEGYFHTVKVGLQRSISTLLATDVTTHVERRFVRKKTNCPARGMRNNTSIIFFISFTFSVFFSSLPAFLRYVCCPVSRLSFMADCFCCSYYFNAFYTYFTLNNFIVPFFWVCCLLCQLVTTIFTMYYLYLLRDGIMLTNFLFLCVWF